MSTRTDNLRSCPFCGSADLELGNLVDEDDWFVSCNGCQIQQIANYTRDVAIERWNRRGEGQQRKEVSNDPKD